MTTPTRLEDARRVRARRVRVFRAEPSDANFLIATLSTFEAVEEAKYDDEAKVVAYRIGAPEGEAGAYHLAITRVLEAVVSAHHPMQAPEGLRKHHDKER